jgi:hypothetical protein
MAIIEGSSYPKSWTGYYDFDVDTGAGGTYSTAIELTAARNPSFLISVGTVTAGAFKLVLFYK